MKAIYISNILSALIFSAIILWIVIAVLRTGYNLYKVYDERELLNLSDREKKSRHFGSSYDLMKYVLSVVKEDEVVGFYSDGREFYLGRYEIYPTKAIWLKNQDQVVAAVEKKSIQFLFVYPQGSMPLGKESGLERIYRTPDKKGALYKV